MININNQPLTLWEKSQLVIGACLIIIVIIGTYMRIQQEIEHQNLFKQYEKEHFQNLEKGM